MQTFRVLDFYASIVEETYDTRRTKDAMQNPYGSSFNTEPHPDLL